MKLNILFYASLLLRLTHAGYGDDFCSQMLGNDINWKDCKAAYDTVPVTQPGDLPTLALMRSGLFSGEPETEARFKLPQTFTSGQCIIEIAMVKGVDYAATTWDYQRKAVKSIFDLCVQPHGIGGRIKLKATTIEIRKKTNRRRPDAAAAVSKCEAEAEGSALYKCLKDAEAASVAANRAYQDYSDRIDGLLYQIDAALDDS